MYLSWGLQELFALHSAGMPLTCCIVHQLACSCMIDSCNASAVDALLLGFGGFKSNVGTASTIFQAPCVHASCKGVAGLS